MKTIEIKIYKINPTEERIDNPIIPRSYAELTATIDNTNMDDHDLAACLFAIEFAANNQETLKGMRVHIYEKEK